MVDVVLVDDLKFLTPKDLEDFNNYVEGLNESELITTQPILIKLNIVFAVSCVHTMPSAFVQALFRFVDVNKDRFNVKVLIEEMYIIDEARNTLIAKALIMNDKPDYVLFIDADNTFQYNTLELLLKEDKDIISGVYFQRHKPFYPLAFKINEEGKLSYVTEWNIGDVVEVDYVGAGCLLVKREVLEKMKYPYFYVARDVESKATIGEDLMFCAEAKKLGFKVWLHCGVNVGHIAGRCVNVNDWFMFKERGDYQVNYSTDIVDIEKYCLHKELV